MPASLKRLENQAGGDSRREVDYARQTAWGERRRVCCLRKTDVAEEEEEEELAVKCWHKARTSLKHTEKAEEGEVHHGEENT